MVATVGRSSPVPVRATSSPGQVQLRPSTCTPSRGRRFVHAAIQHFIDYAEASAASRGVTVTHATSIDQAAVPMCSHLSSLLLASASRATGVEPPYITSGAGHDAMIVARRVPSAILFLRSPGGLSHHPDEERFCGRTSPPPWQQAWSSCEPCAMIERCSTELPPPRHHESGKT